MRRADRKRLDLAAFFERHGRALALLLGAACLLGGAFSAASGCNGWDPTSPFERNAPEVDRAIRDLDAGSHESAEQALESYLGTGACSDAGIGLPDSVRQKPNGAFDLGLTLFYLAERYGQRFGDEELDSGAPDQEQGDPMRGVEIDCALIIAKAIGADPSVPAELRARARYLAGNLEFLRRKYEEAVKYYDQALSIVPGLHAEAGGDGIGRDAAWNRAIALRRIQDQKDAEPPDAQPDAEPPDAEPDAQPDAEPDAEPDAQPDSGDQNDGGEPDAGDAGPENDGGPQDQPPDAGADRPPPPEPPPQQQPEPGRQDDRMLDQLEEAPNYQEQEAKNRANTRRSGRAMEDK
jgi:tetratricopeptide (TPR) repeat protein